mmetsp:Transcript_114068/g.333404  ORF Transcript_114068/g.333404 Transcript_114068/m.333404 type:complete len:489 (+) Transcript_114068:482-1948(+)
MPVCPDQDVLELHPSLRIGIRAEPLRILPLVEPLQIGAQDQPAAVEVQGRQQHAPRGDVLAPRPAEAVERLHEGPEEHLLLRGPGAALLALAHGGRLAAVPDGGAGAEAAPRPVLELRQDQRGLHRELLEGRPAVPVPVQRPPEVHGAELQLGLAAVVPQRGLRDVEGGAGVQDAPQGADLVAVALPDVLEELRHRVPGPPVGVQAPVVAPLARDHRQLLEDVGLPGPRREAVLRRGGHHQGRRPRLLHVLHGYLLLPLPHEPHLCVEEPVRAQLRVELQEHEVVLDNEAHVAVVAAIEEAVQVDVGGFEAVRLAARKERVPGEPSLPRRLERIEHLLWPREAVLDPALEVVAQLALVRRQLRERERAVVVVRPKQEVGVAGPGQARSGPAEVREVHLEEAVRVQLAPPAPEQASVALVSQDLLELLLVLLPVLGPVERGPGHLVGARLEEGVPPDRHRRKSRESAAQAAPAVQLAGWDTRARLQQGC